MCLTLYPVGKLKGIHGELRPDLKKKDRSWSLASTMSEIQK